MLVALFTELESPKSDTFNDVVNATNINQKWDAIKLLYGKICDLINNTTKFHTALLDANLQPKDKNKYINAYINEMHDAYDKLLIDYKNVTGLLNIFDIIGTNVVDPLSQRAVNIIKSIGDVLINGFLWESNLQLQLGTSLKNMNLNDIKPDESVIDQLKRETTIPTSPNSTTGTLSFFSRLFNFFGNKNTQQPVQSGGYTPAKTLKRRRRHPLRRRKTQKQFYM